MHSKLFLVRKALIEMHLSQVIEAKRYDVIRINVLNSGYSLKEIKEMNTSEIVPLLAQNLSFFKKIPSDLGQIDNIQEAFLEEAITTAREKWQRKNFISRRIIEYRRKAKSDRLFKHLEMNAYFVVASIYLSLNKGTKMADLQAFLRSIHCPYEVVEIDQALLGYKWFNYSRSEGYEPLGPIKNFLQNLFQHPDKFYLLHFIGLKEKLKNVFEEYEELLIINEK